MSSAIDHWGFYNGASANVHYGLNIPSTTLSYTTTTAPHVPITDTKGGSNRTTDEEKMKLGTLKKISYPTGGATTFEYEANTYYETGTSGLLAPQEQLEGSWSGSQRISQSAAVVVNKTLPKGDTLRYKWENLALEPVSEDDISTATIKVFKESDNTFLGQVSVAAMYSDSAKAMVRQGPLTDLIEDLPSNTPLRFEMSGTDMNSSFTFQQMDLAAVNENVKIGGLRVKKITNHDGTSVANDVVKTYVYEGDTPGQSSGLLYSKPVYGHIFLGCIGQCTQLDSIEYCQEVSTHFFFETSVVPLGSFEGYHVGYSSVKEYLGSTSSHYNIYKYFNEAGPAFAGLPVVPIQPRIGLGEMQSRHQVYNGGLSAYIAYDIYGKKAESDEIGLGAYIKFNTYRTGGNSNGTPITFWKSYQIKTRPYRVETVESFLDGKEINITRQYNGTNHLQMTKESVTNSDGKVTATDYKYSFDMPGLPTAEKDKFIELNLLVPLETAISVAGTQVTGSQTDYDFFSTTTGAKTSTPTGSFLRPYQFKKYEGGWVLKGEIGSYHFTGSTTGRAGLPKEFTKTGWDKESYEWTSAGLIKKRTFKDFNWQYEYAANTALVTKITNPDGQFSEYVYDPLMRVQEVKSRASNVKTAYTYTYPTVSSGVIGTFGSIKSTTTFTAIAGGVGTQETFQYFDGLGRDIETVHKGKTSSGKDQVIATGYDNRGRVSKNFEPFASSVSDGSYQAPGSNPHTLTQYEESPLNRVWKITPPSWPTTTTTYGANTSGDAVKNYNILTGTSTTFAGDLLAKVTVTDGNGNKTISFSDKKGRLLLSRKANGADERIMSDTYYVYDDKDRLIRVVPPGAAWTDAELVFTYQYTNNDLISQKKVPGKAYEAFEYNSRDLPVRYQDPVLRANSTRWMGSKYDAYGRLTEKGVWASGSGDGIVLTNKIVENIYGTAGIEIDKLKTTKVQAFTVGDPVVTPTAANAVLQTTFNYDAYGRISGTTGNNHTNVASLTAENIGYTYDHGDNILTETRSSAHSAGTTSFVNTRQFDSWGRLTQTSQNLNGAGNKVISELSYTDKDQLSWKKLGSGLQQIDYGYLPNGLLSNINGTATLSASTYPVSNMLTSLSTPTFSSNSNGDLFREVLEYNSLTAGLGGTTQNSGNIGQMLWQVKGRATQAYGFTYDYLDRLTASKFASYKSDGTIDATEYYGETQAFDVRGNITSITRKGMVKGPTGYTKGSVTSQTMTVESGTNLSKAGAGVTGISSTYGTMDVPHNHLNLPAKFEFNTANKIELLYDGQGNKLRKTVTENNVVKLTQDYLDGIELKNNVVEAVYNEEGRAFNNAGTYRYEYALRDHLGNTRVVFTDKSANGAGIQDQTEILSETHYYPFGKTMDGAWYNDASAPKYKYLYNGKELTEEFDLNFYDYGARWFDPGMASWWEIDPASENSRRWSPYAYGNNNPVRFIDPDGRESSAYGGLTSSNEIATRHSLASDDFRSRDRDGDKKPKKSDSKSGTTERILKLINGLIPNGTKIEINGTVGPQFGFNIGKKGIVQAKADLTAASFKLGSLNYQKQNGKSQFNSQLLNSIHNINKNAYSYGGMEMVNKIGLEGNIGSLSLGSTLGMSQDVSFENGGSSTNSKTFRETTMKEGGIMGTRTEEFKYGQLSGGKFQAGFTLEIKMILGLEFKMYTEQ
jgi:RHS repeat-associated protein